MLGLKGHFFPVRQDWSHKFEFLPVNFICKSGASALYVEKHFTGPKKDIFSLVGNLDKH